jgi:hypothetical protein
MDWSRRNSCGYCEWEDQGRPAGERGLWCGHYNEPIRHPDYDTGGRAYMNRHKCPGFALTASEPTRSNWIARERDGLFDRAHATPPPAPRRAPPSASARRAPRTLPGDDRGLFSFSGHIGRWRFLGYLLVTSILGVLLAMIAMDSDAPGLLLVILPLAWIHLAAHAKRLRDAGWSPWLTLLICIPWVGLALSLLLLIKPAR